MAAAAFLRSAVLGAIITSIAGCAAESPSATPSVSTQPHGVGPSPVPPSSTTSIPLPSLGAAPTTAAAPSLAPVPVPTVLPPGSAFDVSWTVLAGRDAPSVGGSLTLTSLSGWEAPTAVRWMGGAVVAYPTDVWGANPGPMIWWSPDLVGWSRVVPAEPPTNPDPELALHASARQVVVGGPGLAVLGGNVNDSGEVITARIWTSASGDTWREGVPPGDARFIWGRAGRLVVFGRSTWVSADGSTWTETGPSPFATMEFLQQARAVIVDDGDGAVVLARSGFDGPTAVYRLDSDGTWEQRGVIEGHVRSAVRGPTGIVALGWTLGEEPVDAAWTSSAGTTWERRLGAVPVGRLVGVATGYVVVGARSYYEGCDGFDPSTQVVNTWTSPDGLTWQLMPEDGAQDHVDLQVVLPDGDRLIAFGLKWLPDGGSDEFEDRSTPSVWASGPLVPPEDPAPRQTASGCGGD